MVFFLKLFSSLLLFKKKSFLEKLFVIFDASKITKSFSKNDFFLNNNKELNNFKKNTKELKHKNYLQTLSLICIITTYR